MHEECQLVSITLVCALHEYNNIQYRAVATGSFNFSQGVKLSLCCQNYVEPLIDLNQKRY